MSKPNYTAWVVLRPNKADDVDDICRSVDISGHVLKSLNVYLEDVDSIHLSESAARERAGVVFSQSVDKSLGIKYSPNPESLKLLSAYTVNHPSWDGECHFALFLTDKGDLAGAEIQKPDFNFWRNLKYDELVVFNESSAQDWFNSVIPSFDKKLGLPTFTSYLFFIAGGDEGEAVTRTISEGDLDGVLKSDGAFFDMSEEFDAPVARSRVFKSSEEAYNRMTAFGTMMPKLIHEGHCWIAPMEGNSTLRELCMRYYESAKYDQN